MVLQMIGADGLERDISTIAQLVDAIKKGQVTGVTLVRTGPNQKWVAADDHPECQALLSAPQIVPTTAGLQEVTKLGRWRLAFYAVGAAALMLSSVIGGLSAGASGNIAGQAVMVFLVAAVVGRVLDSQRKDLLEKAKASALVASGFAIACALLGANAVWSDYKERQTAAGFASRMEAMLDTQEKIASDPASAAAITSDNDSPGSSGSWKSADLNSWVEEYAERKLRSGARYVAALAEAGTELLAPAQLADASGRRTSLAAIASLRVVVEDVENEARAIDLQAEEHLAKVLERSPSKRAEVEAFRSSVARTQPQTREWFALQRQQLDAFEAVVRFAEANAAEIEVSPEGLLLFPSEEAASAYNGHIAKIRDLAATEASLSAVIQDGQRKAIADLNAAAAGK